MHSAPRGVFPSPYCLCTSASSTSALAHGVSSLTKFRTSETRPPTWPSQMVNPHISARDHPPYKTASKIVHYDPFWFHLDNASFLKHHLYSLEVSPLSDELNRIVLREKILYLAMPWIIIVMPVKSES